jgi:hypothetical protein
MTSIRIIRDFSKAPNGGVDQVAASESIEEPNAVDEKLAGGNGLFAGGL